MECADGGFTEGYQQEREILMKGHQGKDRYGRISKLLLLLLLLTGYTRDTFILYIGSYSIEQ